MKRIFTPLFAVLVSGAAMAGTPVIDGVYDPAEGWGAAVGTGDGNAGWADANAKKLYVTYDNNYVYYGAEFSAQTWQQFLFVVNTKAGGGRTDAWGRTIAYEHTNAPDFIFRGDIGNNNYTEHHIWDGNAWTNTGIAQNPNGTETKSVINNNNGFIEIRVPRSTIGFPGVGDVQFIIGGNQGGNDKGHGCFDAIPNDNNGTGWDAPANFTRVSNYVSNVTLPLGIRNFNASKATSRINLSFLLEQNDGSISKVQVQRSNDATNWSPVTTLSVNRGTQTYQASDLQPMSGTNFYRLSWTNTAGRLQVSQVVAIRFGGNANGWSIFPNPVRDRINVEGQNISAGNYGYRVLGTSGQVVMAGALRSSGSGLAESLPANSLPKGRYTLQVTAPDGKTSQVSFIKE